MNKQEERIARMIKDPWLFLKYATYTMDEADHETVEAKRFPYEKPFFKPIVELWKKEEPIVAEKSRQMMVSWVFAALHLHYAFTRPNRKVLLLSETEEKAKLLLDRIDYIYRNIPEEIWPKAARPGHRKTASKIEFTDIDSTILSLSSSPDAARSITASRIFMDEFAFMENVEEVYQGALGSTAGGGLINIVSTNPVLKHETDCLYWRICDGRLEGSNPDKNQVILDEKGLQIIKRNNGYNHVKLHYSADPERDDSWADAQRKKYDARRWATEMELSRATYGGSGIFSDDYNENIHVLSPEHTYTPDLDFPILRGWDFGGNQSVIFCQYYDGHLYVFREHANMGWTTRDVGQRIKELSEQMYPGATFVDVIDPTGFDRGRNDAEGKSNADILNELGYMHVKKGKTNKVDTRIDAVLKLLTSMKGGKPKLLINEDCYMIRTGMSGAYQWEEKLKKNQSRPAPVKNEFSHIMDALQYVCMFAGSGQTENYMRIKRRQLYAAPRQPYYKL